MKLDVSISLFEPSFPLSCLVVGFYLDLGSVEMDLIDFIAVRFHFLGHFISHGTKVDYVGGSEAMSYIDRDKLSLPEVVGHLKDHYNVEEGSLLHWLFPGKDMSSGLRVLLDDGVCQYMSQCVTEGGVADVYVEHGSGTKVANENSNDSDVQVIGSKEVSLSPTFGAVEVSGSKKLELSAKDNVSAMSQVEVLQVTSSDDSDYLPGDNSSSEVDDEVEQIVKKFKEYKKKCKSGEIANLDDDVCSGKGAANSPDGLGIDDGDETPYEDSSEAEESYESGSDEGSVRQVSQFPRYKSTGHRAEFCLGTKFSNKIDFKEAVRLYALQQRKVINFVKDEGYRVRAKCDWPSCPWVCLLSTNSRTDSWQIASFTDEHNCPSRRDNKLVTSRRIANKYENIIRANPQWNLLHMKTSICCQSIGKNMQLQILAINWTALLPCNIMYFLQDKLLR